MGSVKAKVFNFLAFQAGWWACLLSAVNNIPVWAPLIFILVLCLVHFKFVSKDPKKEFLLCFAVAVFGYLMDTFFSKLGVLNFAESGLLAPMWLLGMWPLFSTILLHGMSWTLSRKTTAFVFGAIGGPLTYKLGEKFELLVLSGVENYIIYGVYWGLLMLAVHFIIRRFKL